ncbi:MAG: hypothetical protein WA006_08370 [Rhodoglobus sp.]
MARPARTTTAVLTLFAAIVALTSCSLFSPGPPRDADGDVTEPTVTGTQYLFVDDCFSFTSDVAKVEVTPCASDHTHVVIGQGTLTTAEVDAGGGLQNAVSAACAEPFAAFKEAVLAEGGTRPEQEFIVAKREVDGVEVSAYSCVATDAPVTAAG